MLSKVAVEAFKNRKLKSFDWLKQVTHAELDNEVTYLLPPPRFVTQPRQHQLACFLVGAQRSNFLFLLDLGLGKTKITLDILYYRIFSGEISHALIVVPNIVNVEGWMQEIKLHQPGLLAVDLSIDPARRRAALEKEANLYIIHYAGLVALLTRRVPGKRGKQKLVVDREAVAALAADFQCMVLDESQAIKNWRTVTFDVCNALAQTIKYRYALTGTPYGRNLMDLWAQFYVIDGGATLGTTLGIFRAAYFNEKINYWGGREYSIKAGAKAQVLTVIKNRSIAYETSECHDLPKRLVIKHPIRLGGEARHYYAELLSAAKAAGKDHKKVENVFLRMRQVCSGFLGYAAEDVKGVVEFDENPRLDALCTLIEDLPPQAKAVVFHEFTLSGERICERLTAMKVKHVWLHGATKDKRGVLRTFMEDPTCRVFVVNHHAGSSGLNLQAANYSIYYESPVSPIVRTQSEKRTWRPGQTKTVFQYDFVAKGTVDERILQFLAEGQDLRAALFKGSKPDLSLLGAV